MKDIILNSPEFTLYKYLLIGIGLFLVFRIGKVLVPFVFSSKSKRRFALQFLPLLEIKVWVFFLIMSIIKLENNFKLVALSLFIVLLIGIIFWSWFSMREYMAGISFRTNYHYTLGETILFRDLQGTIKKFGYRHLEIESPSGRYILIPYSQLVQGIVGQSEQGETIISHLFNMKLDKAISIPEVLEEIRTLILQLPWSSLKRMPQIRVVKEEDSYYSLEILIFAIEKDYFFLVENAVKTFLKNKTARLTKSGFNKV